MSVSIKKEFKAFPVQEEIELKRVMSAVLADLTQMRVEMADYKAIYDAHVHLADGNAATTSIPDSSTATGSPGAASIFVAATALTIVE